jgi:hypothetical protein
MLFITTAMQPEARSLIAGLGLKKNHCITRFRVYESPECALIVSGTGKVRSAVATTFLLTHYRASREDFWVNVGVCGAAEPGAEAGSLFLINRIRDHETRRELFPDILYEHDFAEEAIETFSAPVASAENADFETRLVDMEASGAFEAARFFLPPHRAAMIKVVLDCLEPDSVSREDVEGVMRSVTDMIVPWLKRIGGDELDKEELTAKACLPADGLLESCAARMDLSEALRVELDNLLKYLHAADPEGESHAACMLEALSDTPERINRREAKRIVSTLREEIRGLPLSV